MPAAIFNGDFVKTLKDQLRLGDTTELRSGTVDPSAGGGVEAPIGSMFNRTTNGELYLKTGGTDTDWTLVPTAGGGSGGADAPVGSIFAYGGAAAPTGYLLCDGASYAALTYPDLHTAIGDAFGGDGGTNFNVPDLRGQFLRGVDSGAGNDPDSGSRTFSATGGNINDNVGSKQSDQYRSHTHTVPYNTTNNSAGSGSISGSTSVADSSRSTNASGGNETRPTNVYVTFIIKSEAGTNIVSNLEVEDEAVSLSTAVTKINFAGAGVTATEPVADEILVTIPGGGGGSAIEVEDEGISLTTDVTKFNFVGPGVTVTEPVADQVEVNVSGADGTRFPSPVHFKMGGLLTTPADQLDSASNITGTRTLNRVRIYVNDSGASGSSTIRINKGNAGAFVSSFDVTFTHNNGPGSYVFNAPGDFTAMTLVAGDYIWPEATAVGAGGFEDLGITCEFADEKINYAPAHFALHGPVTIPLTRFGAPWNVNGDRTAQTIRLSAADAGTAGSTVVRIHRDGPSGASSVTASLAFNDVNGSWYSSSTSVSLSLQAGDVMWAELESVATGGVEDLGVDVYWGVENLTLSHTNPIPAQSAFKLNGILNTTVDRFDSFQSVNGPRNMRALRVVAFDSGTSGSTIVRINRGGPSGSATADVSLPANGGINSAAQLAVNMDLQAGDYIWPSIPQIASGGIEDLAVDCFYGSEALMSSVVVGGYTFTNIENLRQMVARQSNTTGYRYNSFRATDGTFYAPSGKDFHIKALRAFYEGAGGISLNLFYGDSSVTEAVSAPAGFQSYALPFTGASEYPFQASTNDATDSGTKGEWALVEPFIVPAGSFPGIVCSNGITIVHIFGEEV